MAFQSDRKLVPCYACGEMLPFFEMIESWRPEHSLDDPMTLMQDEGKEPMTGRKKGERMCELKCRKEE
eukprot:10842371-Prorocentrum_lima.AAC.1